MGSSQEQTPVSVQAVPSTCKHAPPTHYTCDNRHGPHEDSLFTKLPICGGLGSCLLGQVDLWIGLQTSRRFTVRLALLRPLSGKVPLRLINCCTSSALINLRSCPKQLWFGCTCLLYPVKQALDRTPLFPRQQPRSPPLPHPADIHTWQMRFSYERSTVVQAEAVRAWSLACRN